MTFDKKIWLSNTSISPGRVYNFHIDLATRKCTRVQADRASVEFPNTHPYRHGVVGTRYNYLMASDRPGQNIPYRDIVKVISPCINNVETVFSCVYKLTLNSLLWKKECL
jgi:carotenoid cleavage dioxygenase-like enzyme